MEAKFVRFIFFANYFIGILAIMLSIETMVQLQMPLNSFFYYLVLFCGTVFYYTYAYTLTSPGTVENPRTRWYKAHRPLIRKSQPLLFIACVALVSYLVIGHFENIKKLSPQAWLILFGIPFCAVLYYGLLPQSPLRLNLRNTGWLKSFVIGFVWACCVGLLPLVILQIEIGRNPAEPALVFWLFIKNWMFCTVNAIMFDMKDYADDANRQLKTFVVKFGLRKTIYFVLLPLSLVGLFSMIAFAISRQFSTTRLLWNLVPFVCLILLAYSLQKRKSILFYLVVIDGLLLLKAVCGIAGMQMGQ